MLRRVKILFGYWNLILIFIYPQKAELIVIVFLYVCLCMLVYCDGNWNAYVHFMYRLQVNITFMP